MDRPWRELRARPHIELRFDAVADEAGGAVYGRRGDRAVIVLSPSLDQVAQRCALAHELVHDDYGVTVPPATAATMERIEAMTRQATAEWLVPMVELGSWVAVRAAVEPVTAELVAEEYSVTVEVAALSLARLALVSVAG